MRTVILPSSKSIALRTLLLASVARGVSEIRGVTLCDDVKALLSNFETLGVPYSVTPDRICVEGRRWQPAEHLYCGESGFLARTLPFLSAIQGHAGYIEGSGSLLHRQLNDLSTLFAAAGGSCSSSNDCLPMTYTPLLPQRVILIDKLDSSQSLSGLLMALPLANDQTGVKFSRISSLGYIDATLGVIRKFSGTIERFEGLQTSSLASPISYLRLLPTGYLPWNGTVETDWSAAAQVIATLQVDETLCLQGLNPDSFQPDRSILQVIENAGWSTQWDDSALYLNAQQPLRSFSFDATDTPDLFPALAALATQAVGQSAITGVHRLRNKESDRATALQTMLSSYGLQCRLKGDTLYIDGGLPHAQKTIPTFHDHRIAMAAAAIGLRCPTPPSLDDTACVAKSYPDFFDCLPTRE